METKNETYLVEVVRVEYLRRSKGPLGGWDYNRVVLADAVEVIGFYLEDVAFAVRQRFPSATWFNAYQTTTIGRSFVFGGSI